MKLSVVIPAHNEAASIAQTVTSIGERLDEEGVDYEAVVVASTDSTGEAVRAIAAGNPRVRCHRSHNPPGFGLAIRAGLDVYEGDAGISFCGQRRIDRRCARTRGSIALDSV